MSGKHVVNWNPASGSTCRFQEVGSEPENIRDVVVTASPSVKEKLLSAAPSLTHQVSLKAERILKGIKNSDVAARLDFKKVAVSGAPFRVVIRTEKSSNGKLLVLPTSFIALSYCWRNSDWEAKEGTGILNGPIAPAFFEALLAERFSAEEGVWIDQLCIDQSNSAEKALAVGSMDLVYRSARLVVVVLEDIVVDHADKQALRALMATHERGEVWDARSKIDVSKQLVKVMWKIFSARWFTRAWCGHELFLSDNHVFFVGTQSIVPVVVRFTAEFLFDLLLIASNLASVDHNQELLDLYGRFYRFMLSKLKPAWKLHDSGDESQIRSYMRVFAEVFEYEASVVSDKLNIVFNVLSCGLFFDSNAIPIDAQECGYIFYHIALAAGDPTALTVSGQQLSNARWMRWPLVRDVVEPYTSGASYRPLDEVPFFSDQEIELDILFICCSNELRRASSAYISKAESIIEECLQQFPDEHASLIDDIVRESPEIAHRNRRFYVELLACILECGAEWVLESWKVKDPDQYDGIEQGICDLFTWNGEVKKDSTVTHGEGWIVVIEFLDALVGLWIVRERNTDWMPAWIQMGDTTTARSLFLCPTNGLYDIAIPALLLQPELTFLKRIWFVTPANSHVVDKHWHVRGKTCSFDTASFEKWVYSSNTKLRQKICS